MKKVLLVTAALLTTCLSVYAQVETMTKRVVKADPMTDTTDGVVWESRHVGVYEYEDKNPYLAVFNPPGHIFSTPANRVKVGMYDNSGKLLAMSESWECYDNGLGTYLRLEHGYTRDSTSFVSKIPEHIMGIDHYLRGHIGEYPYVITASVIAEWLKEHKGYIRIVAPLYGGTLMDVKAKMPTVRRQTR